MKDIKISIVMQDPDGPVFKESKAKKSAKGCTYR